MKIKDAISNTERLDGIMQMIENQKHVSVAMICQEFKVSPATARRDLEELEKRKSIQRVHGGAIMRRNSPPENPVIQRMNLHTEEKRRIGLAASSLIRPGESIFLGSGTTVLEVAKNIKKIQDLTVITNSLLIIEELIDCKDILLMDLGGIVRRSEYSMLGSLTEAAISGLCTDKMIIGIHGIDIEQGLTNHNIQETMTDRKLLEIGKKTIIVADHTKCKTISTSYVAPITVVDTLVTDMEAPQDFTSELEDRGIKVIRT